MKVGILGTGTIARRLATAANGLSDHGVEAYSVASREFAKAETFAKEWGFKKAYGSYEELLADEAVDLVYIATPHSHHYRYMELCLQYKKPVLCEKAFTVNAAQAKDILARFEKAGIFVTEAMWPRYQPSRKRILDLIADGAIGKPAALTANLGFLNSQVPRLAEPSLAGGALLDMGVYTLNFASMLFGNEVDHMTSAAMITEKGIDSQNTITLFYKDGKMAQLYSTSLFQSDRQGVVYGSEGHLTVENICNCACIRVYGLDRKLKAEYPVTNLVNGYEYEVLACQRALSEGALECPEMPHSETIRMMEWMDSLRKSWGVVYPAEVERCR